MPTLYFLDPMYHLIFYVKNFLWLENNALLVVLIIVMLPLLFKHRGSVYYCTLLFSVVFLMTNTLSNAAIRYVYYLQPFLILLSSASVIFVTDYIDISNDLRRLYTYRFLKLTASVSLYCLLLIGTNLSMKLYRLSEFSYPSGVHTRTGVYYIDYRSSAEYVNSKYQDGDLVIALVGDALTYYSDINSYFFVQTYTMRQVFYDPSEASSRYLERIVGNPVIRDFNELVEVASNYKNIWIISIPDRYSFEWLVQIFEDI